MSASPPATVDPSALSQAGAGAATQADLYNQVFGEGSDVSDISDSEDEVDKPRARLPFPPRPEQPVPKAENGEDDDDDEGDTRPGFAAAEDDDDDDDDDAGAHDGDEDDVYVPGTAEQAAKIPKFKKSKSRVDDEDEDMEGDGEDRDVGVDGELRKEKGKKKSEKSKKEKRRTREVDVEEEEAQPVYDEQTLRRMALEERIDNIGKTQRKIKRRKKDEEDIVDSYHEEVCERLRDRMLAAAEKDRIANENKMPGTAKLAMLDDVMAILRNTTMWQPIQDSRLLDAVTQWLEPIRPSGALPAVGIQKAIFEVLPKMDLDTATLKEARLGPIILFYTKTKRVQPSINRQADALIQAWSRPIIKRPANFRSRYVGGEPGQKGAAGADGADAGNKGLDGGEGGTESQNTQVSGSQIKRRRFDYRKALKENEGRRQARVMVAQDIQYTLAPESRRIDNEEKEHVARIQADNRKFNKFARQMKMSKGR